MSLSNVDALATIQNVNNPQEGPYLQTVRETPEQTVGHQFQALATVLFHKSCCNGLNYKGTLCSLTHLLGSVVHVECTLPLPVNCNPPCRLVLYWAIWAALVL